MTKNIKLKKDHTLYSVGRYDASSKILKLKAGEEVYYLRVETSSGTYHTIRRVVDGIMYEKNIRK